MIDDEQIRRSVMPMQMVLGRDLTGHERARFCLWSVNGGIIHLVVAFAKVVSRVTIQQQSMISLPITHA